MKKIFRVCIALLLCFSLVTPAFALDGIWHNPYGIDDLYDHEPTEIYPLTPIAGEMIYIKSTTWPIEPGQSVWLTYTKNGEPQQDVGAEWKYNDGNNSYWEAAIGPFAQGDVIEYTVYADKDGQNTQSKWGGHSHREDPKTGRWRASYVTFERCRDMPGIWKYRGHCFRGETVERGQDPVCC